MVWDVGIPFEPNWAYLQSVRQAPSIRERSFMPTTCNAHALQKAVRKLDVLQFLAAPGVLDDLCTAVRKAWPAP